jgi:hypothetical protein
MSDVKHDSAGGPIDNATTNPDTHQRRTGGSPNDPHGGVEQQTSLRGDGPDPDPVDEQVRVNFEAGREDAERRSAPDLRGGDQPVMRSENEIVIKGEDHQPESRRKV